jgi:glycine oxidase
MTHVIIVGAGVVGLMCAVRLVKAGARVTLLESDPDDRDVFRAGASAAAAGMLAPFDGEAGAHAELALASFDLWRAWTPGSPWADGVRFDGGVIACASEHDAAALQARAMRAGRGVAPLSQSQAAARAGLKAALGHALFVEDEGVADPIHVMGGLIQEARRHGVTIAYDQDVSHVSAHTAETYTGEAYEADHVLLAPGVWANGELMNAAPALKRVRPAKGHLVSVSLAKPLKTNLHAPGFYLARRRDDAVLGASMQFDRYDRHVEQAEVQKLLAAAEAVAPGAVKPAGRAWAGVRPMSPDGWPMVGRSNGMLVAAGHSRNGWLLAPLTAEIITAYVFGAAISPAWSQLSPQRFET